MGQNNEYFKRHIQGTSTAFFTIQQQGDIKLSAEDNFKYDKFEDKKWYYISMQHH